MYIDQSVFNTPNLQTRQSFNPLSLLGQSLSSLNPYNVVWDIINYKDKRRQEEYQKALQKHLEEREDTAYQRTAQDMYKAGLNPLSMQGTDNAGSAVTLPDLTSGTPADSMATTIEKFVNNANNTQLAMDTLKNSENDRRLNTIRTLNEVAQIRANIKNTNIDSKSKQQLLDHMEREYQHLKDNGLYDYDSGITKEIKSVLTYLTTQKPDIKKVLKTQFPWLQSVEDGISKGYLSDEELNKLKKQSPLMYFLLAPIFGQAELTVTSGLTGKKSTSTSNSMFQNIFGTEIK